MSQEKRLEILLRQYSECFSDRRLHATIAWQVPSLTIAINTFLGVVYLGYAKEIAIARLLVLAVAILYTLVAFVILNKNRFFETARVCDLMWLQEELKKIESNIREIKWITRDIICDKIGYPDVPRDFISRISAYKCTITTMIAILIVLVSLLLRELILLFGY